MEINQSSDKIREEMLSVRLVYEEILLSDTLSGEKAKKST